MFLSKSKNSDRKFLQLRQNSQNKIIWIVLSISSIYLTGCDSWFNSHQNPFSIEEITNKKEGKNIYVAGEVIRTIPLVKNGAYQLQDNTGNVWILTTATLPSMEAKISVKGKVQYQELPFSEKELYLQEIETQPYMDE